MPSVSPASVSRFFFTESAFVRHALRRVSRRGTSVRTGLERVKPPRSSRGFDVARYEMVSSPKREWIEGTRLERNTRNESRIDRQKSRSALSWHSGSQPRIFPRAVSFPTRKSPFSEFSKKLKKIVSAIDYAPCETQSGADASGTPASAPPHPSYQPRTMRCPPHTAAAAATVKPRTRT